MKIEPTQVNSFDMNKFSDVLNQVEKLLAEIPTGFTMDAVVIAEINAVIDRILPSPKAIVLPMTSASSLANTLKDHTRADPYGPLAMVPYRAREVAPKP